MEWMLAFATEWGPRHKTFMWLHDYVISLSVLVLIFESVSTDDEVLPMQTLIFEVEEVCLFEKL